MSTQVGGGIYWVLYGAYQIAAELRQPVIGADTLLMSVGNTFPSFRRVLTAGAAAPHLDLDGGGAGVRISPEAELALLRVARESHWQVLGWSSAVKIAPEADAALRLAMALAEARDAPWAGPDHLLEALLTDPGNSAGEFVRQRRVDLDALTEVAQQTWPTEGGQPPRRALSELLTKMGALQGPDAGKPARSRWVATAAIKTLTQTNPVVAFLEDEAIAEAVRLGHDRVTLVHLILAVLVLEEEMAATGLRPAPDYLPSCDFVLRPAGVDREAAEMRVAAQPQSGDIAPPQRRRSSRSNPKNPPWTVAAAEAAEQARTLAGRSGSAHLLYAALTSPDDAGRRLLADLGLDPSAITEHLRDRLELPHQSTEV